MAIRKKPPLASQDALADALFPQEEDEFEDAILSIPPERRVLRTEHYDFSVATLISMLDKKEVQIPEFQRRYVWSDRQASRLIESLIIQCPIPVIYLNQERDETLSVIDGNQRLTSLHRFSNDEFALSGLTSYPELLGLRHSQLDKRFRRHIANRVLRCTVILKETHPQVKFDVFERLNSGAVALTRQELRHGLYYGKLLKAASQIAMELQLEKRLGHRKDKRMKAEELVVRYWALSREIEKYEKPLAAFISTFAEDNRNPPDELLTELCDEIRKVYKRSVDLFGAQVFTFSKGDRSRFNAAVFDAQMVACSRLGPVRYKQLRASAKTIQARYKKLQTTDEFANNAALATSDKASILGRIQQVSALFKGL